MAHSLQPRWGLQKRNAYARWWRRKIGLYARLQELWSVSPAQYLQAVH